MEDGSEDWVGPDLSLESEHDWECDCGGVRLGWGSCAVLTIYDIDRRKGHQLGFGRGVEVYQVRWDLCYRVHVCLGVPWNWT